MIGENNITFYIYYYKIENNTTYNTLLSKI